MLTIGLCDADNGSRKELREIIDSLLESENYEIREYDSGIALLREVSEITVLFLNIDLPDISGIDMKNRINAQGGNRAIIFCSNHENVALDAFDYHVLGFLIKPYKSNEVREIFEKAESVFGMLRLITIKRDSGIVLLNPHDIKYLKAENQYSEIISENGIVTTAHGLKYWEGKLPREIFFRCHKSYIVNLQTIRSIQKDYLILKSGEKIGVSRRKHSLLGERLENFIIL